MGDSNVGISSNLLVDSLSLRSGSRVEATALTKGGGEVVSNLATLLLDISGGRNTKVISPHNNDPPFRLFRPPQLNPHLRSFWVCSSSPLGFFHSS